MKHIIFVRSSIYIILSCCLISFPAQSIYDNVRITGNLVTEPCSLDSKSSFLFLDFGNIVNKFFYLNDRTPGQEFTITLLDCDLAIGQGVMLKFIGKESSIPGLLAPDNENVKGIAIGLENKDGSHLVLLNHETELYPLVKGTTELIFKAYIAREPDLIGNRSITLGPFSATATFELIYP